MSPDDIDLDALHALSQEVDATRRLVPVADQLVKEILNRAARIDDRIVDLNGDDSGEGSPTRMDRILDLSRQGDLHQDLMRIADRICVALDDEPASVVSENATAVFDLMKEIETLKAELETARAEAGR